MSTEVSIILDEEGFVVANKPSGMLCEGGGGRERDLEQNVSELLGRDAVCCHRLDRLTSGLVVLRKGKRFVKELARQFDGGRLRKEYRLLVEGIWDKRIQKVETNIASIGGGKWENVDEGGKPATSTFRVLRTDETRNFSYLSGLLKTGRTHQMRLHAKASQCPIIGDPVYGKRREDGFFGLHAHRLDMKHPGTGKSLQVEAPLPASWAAWLGEG